jgi:hypothetical protein
MQQEQEDLFEDLPFSGLEACGALENPLPREEWYPQLSGFPWRPRAGWLLTSDCPLDRSYAAFLYRLEPVIVRLSRGELAAPGVPADWWRSCNFTRKWQECFTPERAIKQHDIELTLVDERLQASALPEPFSREGRRYIDEWWVFDEDPGRSRFRHIDISPVTAGEMERPVASQAAIRDAAREIYARLTDNPPNLERAYQLVRAKLALLNKRLPRNLARKILKEPEFADLRRPAGG